MKELYAKFKPSKDLRQLSDKELAVLADKFYRLASALHAGDVKKFYDSVLKEKHELLQAQAKKVLEKSNYNIFPELGVVQFLISSAPINEALIDVPTWVKKTYFNLKKEELLVAVGFWLSDDTYKTLQVSQGAWFL